MEKIEGEIKRHGNDQFSLIWSVWIALVNMKLFAASAGKNKIKIALQH